MKRSQFIKAALTVPVAFSLPRISKAQRRNSIYTYSGSLREEFDGSISVVLGMDYSALTLKQSFKDKTINLKITKGTKTETANFILSKAEIIKIEDNQYWMASGKTKDTLSEKYSFLTQNKSLQMGFKLSPTQSEKENISTYSCYLFSNKKIAAQLFYDEDDDFYEYCFLTTACVEHKGLADDCYELETLRSLRENFMRPNARFSPLLEEYKIIGPQLVKQIKEADNKAQILDCIYEQLVCPSLGFIEMNEPQKAVEHYTSFVQALKKSYL